jgi:hypothetical protein
MDACQLEKKIVNFVVDDGIKASFTRMEEGVITVEFYYDIEEEPDNDERDMPSN